MQPSISTGSDTEPTASQIVPPSVSPSVSPSRKRNREALARKTTKLDAPPPRRLRMRLDHSERIWAGRCGCKSPHCMADEYAFSSDTGVSDESEDSDSDCEADDPVAEEPQDASSDSKRPPQNPEDLVPMLLHLMLMM